MFKKARIKALLYGVDTELLRVMRYGAANPNATHKAIVDMIEFMAEAIRLGSEPTQIAEVIHKRTAQLGVSYDIGLSALNLVLSQFLSDGDSPRHTRELNVSYEQLTGKKLSESNWWISKTARNIISAFGE